MLTVTKGQDLVTCYVYWGLIQPRKLTRWTSRSRTWCSPTCSRRSLLINPNFYKESSQVPKIIHPAKKLTWWTARARTWVSLTSSRRMLSFFWSIFFSWLQVVAHCENSVSLRSKSFFCQFCQSPKYKVPCQDQKDLG